MTIKELREMTGLSQGKFAEKYEIPVGTIRHWEIGQREPPAYVMKLLERCVREDIEKEQ